MPDQEPESKFESSGKASISNEVQGAKKRTGLESLLPRLMAMQLPCAPDTDEPSAEDSKASSDD